MHTLTYNLREYTINLLNSNNNMIALNVENRVPIRKISLKIPSNAFNLLIKKKGGGFLLILDSKKKKKKREGVNLLIYLEMR